MKPLISLHDPPDDVVVGDFLSLKGGEAQVVCMVVAQWNGSFRKVTLAVRTATLTQAIELAGELKKGNTSSLSFTKSSVVLIEKNLEVEEGT